MRPIEYRADVAFTQALRCVEYRIPKPPGFKPLGRICALGLRYGLLGAAATHHLFLQADEGEEGAVLQMADHWPELVAEHTRWEISPKLSETECDLAPMLTGESAREALRMYVPLFRRLCPLDIALARVGDLYTESHSSEICDGWGWLRRRKANKEFRKHVDDSVRYALNFFERQQAGLEELPEIALLDE